MQMCQDWAQCPLYKQEFQGQSEIDSILTLPEEHINELTSLVQLNHNNRILVDVVLRRRWSPTQCKYMLEILRKRDVDAPDLEQTFRAALSTMMILLAKLD